MPPNVGRARELIAAAAIQPEPGANFARPVMDAVESAVGFDGYCMLGLDPESGIRTLMFCRDGVGDPRQLAFNESQQRDLHRYVDLGRAEAPVGVLSEDRAEMAHSPRLQEILRPSGVFSEMRLALRSGALLWGAVVLFRDDPRRPFNDRDQEAALALAGPLGHAVRRYQVRSQPSVALGWTPGVLVLDADDELVSTTEAAWKWLAETVAGGLDEDQPRRVHRGVYEVARAARSGSPNAISRVRTTSGTWLAITGERLAGDADHVAVVLQPATVGQLLPAVCAWWGLTPREREALDLAVGGMSGKRIAAQMEISANTVNDHLTSIYRKAGVRGKDELVAHLCGTAVN